MHCTGNIDWRNDRLDQKYHLARSSNCDIAPKRVFGFGSAAVDFRIQTAAFVAEYRDKRLAQKTELIGGGAVANALVQVARLGGKAHWLGKLGDDFIGGVILRSLDAEGVDCTGVLVDETVCSPFNLAVYTGDCKTRFGGFLLPNSLASLTDGELRRLASFIEAGDYVLVEIGEVPLDICMRFISLAKQRRAVVALDVDLDPVFQCQGSSSEVTSLFSMVDLLMPNCHSLNSIYPGRAPSELVINLWTDFGKTAIVSAAEFGVFYNIGSEVYHQSSFDTQVVDTVGAGDALHGGVTFALSAGFSLPEAVRLGARCGAMACSAAGARGGMPTAEALGLARGECVPDFSRVSQKLNSTGIMDVVYEI
jgi:sugar/nucleoside kinase (ribokinase family)